MPDLRHPLHRRGTAPQAGGGGAGAGGEDHRGADVGTLRCRPLRHRTDHADALDPGAERGRHPHRGGRRSAYRRLEARPGPGGRSQHRRGGADARRRGGRARHGLRFDQCSGPGQFRLGSRCPRQSGGADRPAGEPGGGGRLRVQRGPAGYDLPRRPGTWPACRPGRPLDEADCRGGAGDRLPERPAALRAGQRHRLPAAQRGAADLHRQPGRAALGAVAHRR